MMHRTALAFSFALLWIGGTEPARPRVVLRSLLAVAREAEGATDDGWSAAELERIAARVREAIRERPRMAPVEVLNETIFATDSSAKSTTMTFASSFFLRCSGAKGGVASVSEACTSRSEKRSDGLRQA
jgi:hypothetical protein